ncbi:hypothetical protein MANES_05G104200v8 [Manihot esculenta]|uniref:Uncharacterized protein n=1 Tax=Manihot esculenta TaxID=3983 RepID=A0ACB7HNE3_MANES|nr:hypothetical protein MANES_05G104200v8 [Manihot esculenta]
MSSTNMEEKVKEQELGEDTLKDQVVFDGGDVDHSVEELKDSDQNGENSVAMPSPQQEEEAIKKKYGGILPKKKPLISKDQDRAFFDSADWALGKQGAQKPKGPLEALRPKLQELMMAIIVLLRMRKAHWMLEMIRTLSFKAAIVHQDQTRLYPLFL